MRPFTVVVLTCVTSVFSYQVTSPGPSGNWSTTGNNVLTWQRVDTDPLNFTAVLSNQNQAIMPQGPQVLNALVDGTLGQIVCNPPSGGWPQGGGFQVNLARDAQDLNSLLAQSNQFSIVPPTSSMVSTTSSSFSASSSPLTIGTTSAVSTTSSDTSTTPTTSSAAMASMNVGSGLLTAVAALAAFVGTHF